MDVTVVNSVFADNGYRPVVKSALEGASFPNPPGLFTIEEFGGWDRLQLMLAALGEQDGIPAVLVRASAIHQQ